jgi:hypothetical protein
VARVLARERGAGEVWAKREGVVRVGLGQSERESCGGVHGPKTEKKEREERKKKRGGGFPSCLSAKTQERKERKRERGRGEKERGHAKCMCPRVTRDQVHKCENIKRKIKR